MRKLISTIATLALTSSTALPLVACTPDNSLKIAFVPSKDAIEVMKIVKPLEGLLKNKIKSLDPDFNRNVKITTTTDYQAVGQALQDGKTALAFLPMGTYTDYHGRQVTPGNYADAAPLVIAQRNSMIPETDSKTEDINNPNSTQQITIVQDYNKLATENGGITDKTDAYNKLYHKTGTGNTTSFYRSEIIINNTFLNAEKTKGLSFDKSQQLCNKYSNLILDAISDKGNQGIQLLASNTSGAGVIYPVQWMLDNGIDKSVIADILKNQSRADSYTSAAQNITNGVSDITFGYTDIRADAENVQKDFANTTMIGITKGIPNDGIDYSKKAIKDQKLLAAIREALKELIEDPKNATIFGVYSHTDYITPSKDATPEEALTWEIKENNHYDQATKDIQEAINLIKASQ